MKRRFVVLDRDGTIIVEKNYLADPAGVELLPAAVVGLKRMQELGLGLIIVTNQSGIGRGYFTVETLGKIHSRLLQMLSSQGVHIDGIYYCPHLPEANCQCRKPKPFLIHKAAQDLDFDARQAMVIGDKPCDILLGKEAGAETILVRTGYGEQYTQTSGADYVVADLNEAADVLAGSLGCR